MNENDPNKEFIFESAYGEPMHRKNAKSIPNYIESSEEKMKQEEPTNQSKQQLIIQPIEVICILLISRVHKQISTILKMMEVELDGTL